MLRQRMRCDAPSLSLADYNFIIQCRNNMPRTKVLNELKEKYSISQKRIYQIWRGEEKNRVAWDQPILPLDFVEEGRENIIVPQIKDQRDSKKENLVNELILPSSNLSREGRDEHPLALLQNKAGRGPLDIDHEELNRLYEEIVKRSKKNIASSKRILGGK